MIPKGKKIGGDIICCKDPPATCPRRYCSLVIRSFERTLETIEPKKKKKRLVKKKIRNA